MRENQRLETGPGAYAQVKLGSDVALGLGEGAQVRFDQRSARGSDVVILDQGRVRVLDGAAIGRPTTRALELRTTDGRFGLKGADIEVKTPSRARGAESNTFVKLNGGDARLLNPQGAIAIAKDTVQGFSSGKTIVNKSVSLADVAMARPSAVPTVRPIEPIANLPAVSLPAQTLALRNDVLLPGVPLGSTTLKTTTTLSTTTVQAAPVVSSADQILTATVIDPATQQSTTFLKLVASEPIAPTTSTATTTTLVKTQFTLTPITTTTATTSTITKTQTTTTILRIP